MLGILIVDDEAIVRNGMKNLIPWSQLDAQIVGEADNGQDALDLAFEKHPDVIIADVRMPVMDGLAMCKAVHESIPDIINIILSAYDDFSYAQSAIRYGVTDYILKPIDPQKITQLTERINEISRKKKNVSNLINMLNDSNYMENLSVELRSGNAEYFKNFFDNEFPVMYSSNEYIFMELINKLLMQLFTFISTSELDMESCGITREKAWNRLLLEKSVQVKVEYVKQLYLNVVQFINCKKNSHGSSVVEYVKNHIERQYKDPDMTVCTIASKLNYSSNYLSNLFSNNTNDTISSYITHVRIEKALELFKNPSNSVSEIARSVGYNDPNYFAKVFKRHTGTTPLEYKNLSLYAKNGDSTC